MAVIRQQTQVFNKPVGVVRADAGAAEVGASIARAADQVAGLAYREAAIQAEERGQKQGLAASRADIVSIDPNTGMPVAYAAPTGYGTIATRSYQAMIDRRFEESIVDELKTRGAEIAKNSASAAQYKSRMTDYVQSMYENAVSESGELNAYGRIIEELGTDYVTSTYTTLANKEAAAAKAALERQQQMQSYLAQEQIGAMVSAGADPEEIGLKLGAEYTRNDDLLRTGGISFSSWKSQKEKLDGLRSLSSSNELASIYGSLDERGRNDLALAVQNPAYVVEAARRMNVDPSALSSLIVDAKISSSVPTILSGFNALGGSIDQQKQFAVNETYSKYAAEISPMLTATGFEIKMSSIPTELRADVLPDLEAHFVEMQLDTKATDANTLDLISNELLNSANPNLPAIREIAGEEVAKLVRNMTPERRETLSKGLMDRRAELARIETAGETEVESSFREQIRASGSLADFTAINTSIESSGLDPAKIDTLLGINAEKLTDIAQTYIATNQFANLQEFENLRDVIVAGAAVEGATPEVALLQEAYRKDPSKINSAFSRRSEAWSGVIDKTIADTNMNALALEVAAGKSITPENMVALDKHVTKNNIVTVENWTTFPTLVSAASNGIIMPSVAKAISSALASNDEAQFARAAQMFEQYSNLGVELRDGTTGTMDAMRQALDPNTYATFATTNYVAKTENKDPMSVLLELRSYDGDLDADVKGDLGLPQNATIDRALDAYPMSTNYRREIVSLLRIQKARGQTITTDFIEQEIDRYSEFMTKDTRVLGPKIGDASVYALRNFVSAGDIVTNENQLATILAASGQFDDLLDGGNVGDAVVQNVISLFGLDMLTDSKAVYEAFAGGLEATTAQSRSERIKAGLSALGVDLYYDPVVESFNSGKPAWRVGYMTNGRFEPIIVNDVPWTLQKSVAEDSTAVFQRYNMYLDAVRSAAPQSEQIRAEIGWLAARGFTMDEIRNDPKFSEKDRILRKDFGYGVANWFDSVSTEIAGEAQ